MTLAIAILASGCAVYDQPPTLTDAGEMTGSRGSNGSGASNGSGGSDGTMGDAPSPGPGSN